MDRPVSVVASTRLPAALYEQFSRLAQTEERSTAEMLRRAVKALVAAQEAPNGR